MTRSRTGKRLRTRLLALAIAASCVALTACAGSAGAQSASSSGVLTIAMTAGDIPNLDTVLSGEQGYEGYRFVGNQLYDSLTKYDLKQGKTTPGIIPGLATKWAVDDAKTTWTFTLRHGVTFTDGTPFNADAVVFNLDRYLNKSSPRYNTDVAARAGLSLQGVKSYTKVDDSTVSITTNGVYSHLPEDLVFVYMASPTALQKYGADFSQHPVGTGPFKLDTLTRGQQAVFDANTHYWDGAPKLKKLVLKPMPDVSARLAALRSGEVNWAEAPNPDDIASLKSAGFTVLTNSYDHIWPWILDTTKGPLKDVRVRRALNFAIDRTTMSKSLLDGTADPALQLAPRANTAYRTQNNVFSYDPARAKKLLAEAGYADGFSMTVSYPTGGSGNMQPGPMNQQLQSDLAKVGVKVQLKPIEWATLLTAYVSGTMPDNADALNISLTFIQETSWSTSFLSTSPTNVGHYANPKVDALIAQSLQEIDPKKRSDIYAELSAQIDEDAPWLVVVNDRNPRVLASDVKGFVQPKSWFVDLTDVTVG